MTVLFVACSVQAYKMTERIREEWQQLHPNDSIRCLVKCSLLPDVTQKRKLTECIKEWFHKVDAIVFFCAAGIAVRCIAPCVIHKSKDPAVLVMDETGAFCISLLSGHVGGANRLAEELADIAGAIPVITTASDREGKMSVDLFAVRNRLSITDWQAAKELEARLLAGERIGLLADEELGLSICGELPEYLTNGEDAKGCGAGIHISIRQKGKGAGNNQPFPLTLRLIPNLVVLGIGCRKGTGSEQIEKAVNACLQRHGICREALTAAASIDLKKDEQGIHQFCSEFAGSLHRKEALPFLVFSAEELRRQTGEFTASEFVSAVTGVDNICERSAVAACAEQSTGTACGRLLARKFVMDGVTVALAMRDGILTV